MSEAEATGSVAETYADIRQVTGLPLVNLVYRTLAAEPGRLEGIWRELRPNMVHPAFARAAAELIALGAAPESVVSIPPSALAAVGVGAEELARAAATLEVYGRANSRNLLAVLALLEGASGTSGVRGSRAEAASKPAAATSILPMADLSGLEPALRVLLEDVGAPITGREEPILVPSLPRHFAHNAALLALLWTAVRPAVLSGSVERAGVAVATRAATLAGSLPHPVRRLEDEQARAVVERFGGLAMPRMLVVGAGLRRALDEGLTAARLDATRSEAKREGPAVAPHVRK